MIKILLVGWLLITTNAYADQIASDGADSQLGAADTSPFGQYLGCVNRLHPPFASRLKVTTEDSENPEQDRAIFYGNSQGKTGIFLVTPSVTTMDQVPQYTPESGVGMPEYPLAYKHPNGSETVWHYYVDPGESHGSTASTGPDFRQSNPGTPFYTLGSPQSKIPNSQAIEALENEVLPALKSMPAEIETYKEYSAKRYGKVDSRVDEEAKEALCACLETENQNIHSTATEIASKIGYGRLPCDSKPISWFDYILPKAEAFDIHRSPKNFNNLIELESIPSAIRFSGKSLNVCTSQGEYQFFVSDLRLLRHLQKCSLRKESSKSLVTSSPEWTAEVHGNRVTLHGISR